MCALLAMVLTACGNVYSRDDFTTAVIGKSDTEVTQRFGKPASIDDSKPNQVIWTYSRTTFDLAHENRIDSTASVIFQRQDGGLRATKVEFG
jgi:hypothetical protein